MTLDLVVKLQEVSVAQLEAARRGDLDALEACELERRALVESLESDSLARLAADEPDLVGKALRLVLENDRLVKAALREGMRQRGKSLKEVERRRRAERAYRGMASGSS